MACLQTLSQQTHPAAEILIIDDGSAQGPQIGAQWSRELPIRYDWRPNDRCMSRSYNRAVQQTRFEHLVFISSDILLNPQSLSFYTEYYRELPPAAIWGYFGSYKQHLCPSRLIPGRSINLLDHRLWFNAADQICCPPDMLQHPQYFAWGGNWALPRQLFMAVGGFNEDFQGWGFEDVEFANRLIAEGIHQIFAVDVWGEHQVHRDWSTPAEIRCNRSRIHTLAPLRQEPGLLYNPQRTQLATHLRSIQENGINSGGTGTEGGQ